MRTARAEVAAFTTKDGSTIRELLHPGGTGQVSLAEATVPPGASTTLHRHHRTEELYHFLAGDGVMTLGASEFAVRPGDSVRIPPGTPHRVRNASAEPLVLLCACAPPYSHEDTELLE